MSTKLNEARKLCIIKTNGPIPELGYITGPVLTPCKIRMSDLRRLVGNGKAVYELNPKNPEEIVKLTVQNIERDNFAPINNMINNAAQKPAEEPKKEEVPVTPVSHDANTKKTTVTDSETKTTVQVNTGKSDFKKSK
jgi:hypothetical protein